MTTKLNSEGEKCVPMGSISAKLKCIWIAPEKLVVISSGRIRKEKVAKKWMMYLEMSSNELTGSRQCFSFCSYRPQNIADARTQGEKAS